MVICQSFPPYRSRTSDLLYVCICSLVGVLGVQKACINRHVVSAGHKTVCTGKVYNLINVGQLILFLTITDIVQ